MLLSHLGGPFQEFGCILMLTNKELKKMEIRLAKLQLELDLTSDNERIAEISKEIDTLLSRINRNYFLY